MSKRTKRHGFGWWLFIGWWWYPIKWIYYSIPAFIIRKIYKAITSRKNTKTEANTQPLQPTPVKRDPYVYVTPSGKKFHYDIICPGILNSKEIKMSLSEAREAGYKACDKCCYDYLHE